MINPNMIQINKKTAIISLIFLLVLSNIFFVVWLYVSQKNLREAVEKAEIQKTNTKILAFTDMFVNDVLATDKDIDFETRLSLESAVRDLEDIDILDKWQKFVGSKNNDETQIAFKNLLELLLKKISY